LEQNTLKSRTLILDILIREHVQWVQL
jgi:hypothetical protein